MTLHMRPYGGAADIERIIELKRICTAAQNVYDAPTVSALSELLTPLPPSTGTGVPWQDKQGRVNRTLYQRALTRQAAALWEESDGRVMAYALLLVPSLVLTFQVHPQARGSGVEQQILTRAMERTYAESTRTGKQLSLSIQSPLKPWVLHVLEHLTTNRRKQPGAS